MKKKIIIILLLCVPLFLFQNLLLSKTINDEIFLRFPWDWNVNQIKIYNTSAYVFSKGKEVIMSLFGFDKAGDIDLTDLVKVIAQTSLFKEVGEKTINNIKTRMLSVNKTINNEPVSSLLYIMESDERIYLFSFEPKYEKSINEILTSIKIKK